MEKTHKFIVKLNGEGVQIEREVAPEVAKAIVGLVLGGTTASAVPASQPGGLDLAAMRETPALSVREFLESHEAKRIPEQIACIALFLKKHRNTVAFTRKDLVKGFEDAQETIPKNLSRDIAWAKKIGWIAPKTGVKGACYLTGTGEAAVSAKFPAEVRKRTKVNLKPKKKRKARTVIAK